MERKKKKVDNDDEDDDIVSELVIKLRHSQKEKYKDKEKKNTEIKIEVEKSNTNKNWKLDYNKDLTAAKMIEHLKIMHHFNFYYEEDQLLTNKIYRNLMVSSLHDKNGNDYFKGKNAIQVYKALPDSEKITERDYTNVYKQYAKQLANEKAVDIINELISVGIEFEVQQFYDQKVYPDNIIAMYRGKKKGKVIPELNIMKTSSNSLLKMM
jgi:hypothetical protein